MIIIKFIVDLTFYWRAGSEQIIIINVLEQYHINYEYYSDIW